jgi:rare lipoprotein A (peptidoglycan hydrolase)
MKADRNRLWRKDHPRGHAARARTTGQRLRRISLATAILSLALAPLAAEAQTGGAGVTLPESSSTGTAAGVVFSSPMRAAGATWYGPGLYGNGTACGQTLRPGTIGVAHRTLPCGTTIKLYYHGHSLVTKVIDRGPYTAGNDFDLTNGARLALGFEGVGQVRYAVALGSAEDHD